MIIVLDTIPGSKAVVDYRLAYRDILKVKLEGTGYDVVSASPVGRQVQFLRGLGELWFENEFNQNAKVYVWLKD